MIAVLAQRDFPTSDLRLLATERSAGETIMFREREYEVEVTSPESFDGVDLVLASAGKGASKKWLPVAVRAGAVCIDNSSAYRMDPEVPLVVPEINGNAATDHRGIIANPNCSTIQMVMALEPLHRKAELKRVVAATYQSVSGKGNAAVAELEQETISLLNGKTYDREVFPHQIAFNCLPEIDAPGEDGYTIEEWKMIRETRKIMGLPDLKVTVTCVRVPVFFGHAEAVFAEFAKPIDVKEASAELDAFDGVRVVDDLPNHLYPLASVVGDTDDVFVGRIRPDRSVENGLAFWVVADNIRKGAALNTVQIGEWLLKHDMLPRSL
jgi:aspartate-semialdehyde dehydrogenase